MTVSVDTLHSFGGGCTLAASTTVCKGPTILFLLFSADGSFFNARCGVGRRWIDAQIGIDVLSALTCVRLSVLLSIIKACVNMGCERWHKNRLGLLQEAVVL